MQSRSRSLVLALTSFAAAVWLVTPAASQTGTLTGTVTDTETLLPLLDAQVQILGAAEAEAGGMLTSQAGEFRATLAPGTYSLVVTLIGFETRRVDGVGVQAGGTTDVPIALASQALVLNPIVVTASKQEEKAVDAPATVAVVSELTIEERPAPSPVDHLKDVVGVDIIQQGLQASNVVVRGFNNIFSGAAHFLTDNRIAGIPSLRVNLMHFVPSIDEDAARIEVVLGPGSALYGPNTANGVIHVVTKSPLAEQGTSVSVGGGERSIFKGQFRTAHLLGENVGLKVSGSYFRGDEWPFADSVEIQARRLVDSDPSAFAAQLATLGVPQDEIQIRAGRVGVRNLDTERWGGEVRLDWRLADDATAIFQAGRSNNDGIEMTGVGGARANDWAYNYVQARLNVGRLFAQTYLNASDAGESFLIRDGAPLVDNSRMWVAQLQHGYALLDERLDLTYGADYLHTTPDTEGTIHGRYENDDRITEWGVYGQVQATLTERWQLIGALRYDESSVLDDPVWSPRAALVFKPAEEQSFRLTYNRAFSTPSTLNMFLDVGAGVAPAPLSQLGYLLRGQGPGPDGISFQDPSGALRGMRSPFTPAAAGGPSQLLPVDAQTLWLYGVGVLQAQGAIDAPTAQFLSSLNAGQGGVQVNVLDPITEAVVPSSQANIADVPRLEESLTTTYELGWQGLLGNRVAVAADVWMSERENFTSPLVLTTPLLTLDPATLMAFLVQSGVPAAPAGAIAAGLGGVPDGPDQRPPVPLAVVSSPDVEPLGADLVATYFNVPGTVDLWGGDLSVTAFLTDRWTVGATASLVSDDHFEVEGPTGAQTIALNAPKEKGTVTVGYRNPVLGFNGELRGRYTAAFPANSADFVGLRCLGITGPLVQDCVDSAAIFDLTLGYQIPGTRARAQLYVSNLFDTGYQSFVGVPELGRLALLQVRYEL